MLSAHDACRYSGRGMQLLVDDDVAYCVSSVDGRNMLTAYNQDGRSKILVGVPFDVRSKAQGYGGGAFCVHRKLVYFVNGDDQRIYRRDPDLPMASIAPITPVGSGIYGDLVFDPARKRIVCIRELADATGTVSTQIVAIEAEGAGTITVLAEGMDFYSSPRLSRCGGLIAWTGWNFPDMPWNRSVLQVGRIGPAGCVADIREVRNADRVSVIEPCWTAENGLLHLSDESGYWSLHEYRNGSSREIFSMKDVEFGFPPYLLGLHTYGKFIDQKAGGIFALALIDGEQVLLRITDADPPACIRVEHPFDHLSDLQCWNGGLYFLAEKTSHSPEIVRYEPATHRFFSLSQPGSAINAPDRAEPQRIRFATRDGGIAHAIFQATKNQPDKTKCAPLIVNVHGGPTGAAQIRFDPVIDYWLDHGFSWLDVNHRGSTGYGRQYREALNGRWGELEVLDCVAAVKYLCAKGIVDQSRVVIRGASAGGYTALQAVTDSKLFAAAACYYGVTDLELLCRTTHKFESKYLHSLIGDPIQERNLYRERSPIHRIRSIGAPVLFLQGADDFIVPREQTANLAKRLDYTEHVAPYIEFPGEGHGFSKSQNRTAALLAEHYFYARILGLPFTDTESAPTIDFLRAYFARKSTVTGKGAKSRCRNDVLSPHPQTQQTI